MKDRKLWFGTNIGYKPEITLRNGIEYNVTVCLWTTNWYISPFAEPN